MTPATNYTRAGQGEGGGGLMCAAQLRTRRLRGSSCWGGGQLIHCDRAAHPQDARDRAADAARLRASACGGTRISDTYPPYLRRGTRISDSYARMRVAVIISTCIAPRVRTGASIRGAQQTSDLKAQPRSKAVGGILC